MTSWVAHGKIMLMVDLSVHDQNIFQSQSAKISLFVLCIWVLYLVLSPFYIFPKGRPQPADFILIMGVLPVLITQFLNFKIRISPLFLFGGLFVVLTIGVNFLNYLFYPDIRFLLTMLIYPYNFMVFLFVVWLFQCDCKTVQKWTFYGLALTVFMQLLVISFADFGFRGYRGTAGFENPNQLAYWTLLTAAMVVFLRRREPLAWSDWSLLIALTYLQALALSKAGIITFSIFLLLLFLTPKMPKIVHALGIITVLGTLLYGLYDTKSFNRAIGNIEPLQNVVARIEGIGTEADDSPEARGYYRIVEYPLYTLLGSGEGAFYRFNVEGYNRELHSGIATIIFSYGILGALLFFTFLLLLVYRQPWYYVLLFIPIIMFGLPHQNFRFTHFWVFLGINYGVFLAHYKNDIKRKLQNNSNEQAT